MWRTCKDPSISIPRFELKYRISERLANSLRRTATFYLEPDEHSLDGEYTVNSLYFDTPLDEDAYETDEGIALRSKVRLRCYHTEPKPPFFLELKQRFGSSIYKTRAPVALEDAERIADGFPPMKSYRRGTARDLDTIREVIDRREMTPKIWVRYTRLAWTSAWGDGVRMTFDRSIETQATTPSALLDPPSKGWAFPELDGRVVLELKFFEAAPHWMQRIVGDFELERSSCSKYGLGHFSLDRSPVIPSPMEAS